MTDEAEIREGRMIKGMNLNAAPAPIWAEVREADGSVVVDIADRAAIRLTVDQARRFARQIYAMARRVDSRT